MKIEINELDPPRTGMRTFKVYVKYAAETTEWVEAETPGKAIEEVQRMYDEDLIEITEVDEREP